LNSSNIKNTTFRNVQFNNTTWGFYASNNAPNYVNKRKPFPNYHDRNGEGNDLRIM